MLHFFYSLFFRIALPFVLLRLWWIGRTNPEAFVRWQERLGYVEAFDEPVIWVHAVSVGETIAAAPLVKALLRRNPDIPILMTAMTPTGSARARALFGDRVHYAFSPYDTPGAVRRFVGRVRPRALVIMETELWPNMIALSRQREVPIFLINARLSSRSARGYERVASLVRPLLRSISWIAAQAEEDAGRFLRIGATPESVSVTGSIKFDVEVSDEVRAESSGLRAALGADRPVWIAASTHDGEDRQILEAHQQILEHFPNALLMIVPRHPERFDDVARLIDAMGLSLVRRSQSGSDGGGKVGSEVYLGDTMGELLMLYGASDVAFVGGSLIERGGHNPLEPAAWGIPVVSGPHIFNFETIYDRLDSGQGLFITDSAESLAQCVVHLFSDKSSAQKAGHNALAVVNANRGALEKVVDGIVKRV
ncbi:MULTISPECIES: lipid IV(A) 3-deoxy-D-manno-octulosonic acid transferase [Marinobacter]|jgi:3-deoxy-D-manno-octulosonic-acid transferase|uniref:3-deoxy-D-manno-octulosonic acid transferase n=5 Tax=Marinobacter TaxID=2742 RepID=W5YUA9_9GAMM|nr:MULTISPECIES: lipid IV(A) 3-deoxy-D-manno-octulosonic acid transferase [Marinobacter]AHI32812.1 3-deoxy-D-manno-octulosonic acid transferase [Marinobacter salarius]MAB53778.1 3-deoxy-D-manno-octulosonic acid transferase [Marinobacter sp.]MCZ4287089.1 lipid IV(A) 3-deoxy-D-manno-octulosonic acid transferase [Marinobacter salarius]MDM8180060.1 lipid IV(A) 3-deoxy-D-manno-octulosonic acid transferase [Marinobacter salarius]OLF83356.1 3-deoxy-D-manno-octulosonic acid transferase [Marinobacter s|tara:strand:+ start:2646 stop:3914 length:1269 start_codon:yes stop_codon:yes gene_type:complete